MNGATKLIKSINGMCYNQFNGFYLLRLILNKMEFGCAGFIFALKSLTVY